ncbi:UNVERIFIED_CONTAM: hypothetical protein GTU68_040502, partial [Idotea baltica]|nr:hypothetical protein [Idotea baltica]
EKKPTGRHSAIAIKSAGRGSLSRNGFRPPAPRGMCLSGHLADNPIPGSRAPDGGARSARASTTATTVSAVQSGLVSVDVGNPAFNVIPARAEARFNVRFNDAWTLGALKDRIRQTLEQVDTGKLELGLEFKRDASESFLTRDETLIAALSDAVAAVTGRTPELSTGGGTSDARFIKNYCPVVEFGLVGQTMHKVDECVAVSDLERLTAVYMRFLDSFFQG